MIRNHIQKCENRLVNATPDSLETGLFYVSQQQKFDEKRYASPKYAYHFVRAPIMRMGFLYGIRKVEISQKIPDLSDVHQFVRDLFLRAQLSAECSIGN